MCLKLDQPDIIDEALDFFRANVLFRNFKSEGPADLTLCYLTVYIGECLRVYAKYKKKSEGYKNITALSMSGNFPIPGEAGFPLPGFFTAPAGRSDSGKQHAHDGSDPFFFALSDLLTSSIADLLSFFLFTFLRLCFLLFLMLLLLFPSVAFRYLPSLFPSVA